MRVHGGRDVWLRLRQPAWIITPHVAFASESFRKQERNYAAPAAPAVDMAGMSTAVDLTGDGAAESGHTVDTGDSDEQRVRFSTAALWRVRGVGAALVSAIDVTTRK